MKKKHGVRGVVWALLGCLGLWMAAAQAAENREDDELFMPDGGVEEQLVVVDPLEPWNRVWFEFNDKLYSVVLRPVAQGYAAVIPEGGRIAVADFFHNIFMPVRFANALLQGKVDRAAVEVGRFGINTVMGGLGFIDVAEIHFKMSRNDEDLGQTLGVYGLGDGFYLVWPVLGPSNVRDTVGMVGDFLLTPTAYVPEEQGTRLAVESFRRINKTSLWMDEYDRMKAKSLDPYVAMRHAYTSNRNEKIAQ